jgi:hypothetical protein
MIYNFIISLPYGVRVGFLTAFWVILFLSFFCGYVNSLEHPNRQFKRSQWVKFWLYLLFVVTPVTILFMWLMNYLINGTWT